MTYPQNNSLADGLQLLAQVISSIPTVSLLYVQMGGFDHHSNQIPSADNRRGGQHAGLLQDFSDGVEAFYRDLAEHGLADNVLTLQWSEFGRRPEENKSLGTDHGAASSIFVIGNKVKGGIYGKQPSLTETDLDDSGNAKFDVNSVRCTRLFWMAGLEAIRRRCWAASLRMWDSSRERGIRRLEGGQLRITRGASPGFAGPEKTDPEVGVRSDGEAWGGSSPSASQMTTVSLE